MSLRTLIALFTITLSTIIFGQDTIVVAPSQVTHSTEIKVVDPENEVIDFPDVEAQFKGGTEGMQKYIAMNIQYPQEAKKKKLQGKVFLSFIVEKTGEISNIKIDRGEHELLNMEARRVIANMPLWSPGEKNGKIVRTRYRVPINFSLK